MYKYLIQNENLNYFRSVIELDQHIVNENTELIRFVDYVIGVFPQLMTKNAVKKAIKRNELLLNNDIATTGHWMKLNDVIKLVDNENRVLKPFPLAIEIIFEDDYLIVVNKPSGLVVSGNQFRTLENAMVGKIIQSTQKDALKWAKPVHRLDAATSGLLIMSKTATAHRILAKQFENRKIDKTYHAIVMGVFDHAEGEILSPIKNQKSETHYSILKKVLSLRSESVSLVKLKPKTGRTHQLRIHCSETGNPIVGDVLYGEEGNILLHKGLFLAATNLIFNHPIFDELLQINMDIPHKFISLLEREERRWEKFKFD